MRKLILVMSTLLAMPLMADINVTQGSGKTVHTDTVNGVEYQYIKIIDATTGGTSSATVTSANALKVDGSAINQPILNATGSSLAVVSSTTLKVDGSAVTQPISLTGFPLIPTGVNASTVAIFGTVPVSGTFFQGTQPVSITGFPLVPTGVNASTAAVRLQDGSGTAITNTGGALDINIKTGSIGNTSFVATPSGTYATSVSSIGATPTAMDTNSGTKSAGTQRIVIATDQPALTNALKVDPSAVTSPVSLTGFPLLPTGVNASTVAVINGASTFNATIQSNASVNLNQVGGNAIVTGGTNGSQGVGGLAASTATASGNPVLTGLVYNQSHPTLTEGQVINTQSDVNGNLLVKLQQSSVTIVAGGTGMSVNGDGGLLVHTTNGGSGGTSSSFGAAPPTTGTAVGFTNGTAMSMAKVDQSSSVYVTPETGTSFAITSTNTLNVSQQGNVTVVGAAASTTTASGNPVLTGAVYNQSHPTLTEGQVINTQVDVNGNTLVKLQQSSVTIVAGGAGMSVNGDGGLLVHTTNGGSGGTSSNFGAAFPSVGTAVGFTNGTGMSAAKVDSSSSVFVTPEIGTSFAITSTNTLNVSQQGTVTTTMTGFPLAPTGANASTTAVINQGGGSLAVISSTTLNVSLAANQSVNVAQWNGNAALTGGSNGSVGVGGLAASTATASGNPVLIGAVYNKSHPTLTEGQVFNLPVTSTGQIMTAMFDSSNNPTIVNADGGLDVHLLNGGSGGTSSTLGAAPPSLGTAIGFTNGTAMSMAKVDQSSSVYVTPEAGTSLAVISTTSWIVQGPAASTAAASGNPVLIGGVFNGQQPGLTEAQIVNHQVTQRGSDIVATGIDPFYVKYATNTAVTVISSTTLNVALAANQSVNVAQWNGNTSVTGGTNGSVGVGGLASSTATASGNPVLIGAVFNNSHPTLTEGQVINSQVDSKGNLLVNLQTAVPAGANTIGTVNVQDVTNTSLAIVSTNTLNVQGALTNNGAASSGNRIGALPGIAQNGYGNNGSTFTQGRDAAQMILSTSGLLAVSQQEDNTFPTYSASTGAPTGFAVINSTTDISELCGNAVNKVMVTDIRVTCTQTTAGITPLQIVYRSSAYTGTWSTMTDHADDSNYVISQSSAVYGNSNGFTNGTQSSFIDTAQIGCMASATATPNDIYISPSSWRQHGMVLRGTSQCIGVTTGGQAVTGGKWTVTWRWKELPIAP